jgi:UPF0271 protein
VNIDLNADIGEGFGRWTLGDDLELLKVITSANVACGFHAGDPQIMRRVCGQAVELGVAIGAQVGYRDLAGFGRRKIEVDPEDLRADVLYQLAALEGFARAAGGRVRYLKPHGALYNTAVLDPAQATAVVRAVLDFDPQLPILTLAGGALAEAAVELGVRAVAESFADRAYQADGTLVDRSQPGALLTDPQVIVSRAVAMVQEGQIADVDGQPVGIRTESLCVHGDTPGAVSIATRVRAGLEGAGIELRSFG